MKSVPAARPMPMLLIIVLTLGVLGGCAGRVVRCNHLTPINVRSAYLANDSQGGTLR